MELQQFMDQFKPSSHNHVSIIFTYSDEEANLWDETF